MSAAAFNRSVSVFIDRDLSAAARSAALAKTAKAGLAELISSGKATPTYTVFVDGVANAAEEKVRPEGAIIYRFSSIAAVTTFAIGFLRERSPKKSGAYRDGWWIGVNGKLIPWAQFNPRSVPHDAEITIGNKQPYHRKVDVQLIGYEPMKFKVPAGILDDCVAAIRQKYSRIVTAKRVYTLSFPGQYRLQQHQARKDAPHRLKRRAGDRVESPAIIINPV